MTDSGDVFKLAFKKLKQRIPIPDYAEVLDIYKSSSKSEITSDQKCCTNAVKNKPTHCEICDELGLQQHCHWKVYDVVKVPGLKVISNPFSSRGQRLWIKRCLEKYPLYPSCTNLTSDPESDLWKSYINNDAKAKEKLWQLRWTTLGYHHNWNTKKYSEEACSPFPPCLLKLSVHVASILGLSILPQAAIINYYHLDSTLAGHTDHSELDHNAPLLSFSFGRKAIFMIGGKEKCVYPTSLFVRSGDVIVMSGESRLCYHAVPKVFAKESDEENTWNEGVYESDWEMCEKYLLNSRINMNIRQVYCTIRS